MNEEVLETSCMGTRSSLPAASPPSASPRCPGAGRRPQIPKLVTRSPKTQEPRPPRAASSPVANAPQPEVKGRLAKGREAEST